MEKEFVPYDLAIKLKDLGFNEPCFGYYDLDGLQINTNHWYPENKNSSFPLPNTTNNPKISAPTFSQAFRWFREKYDCHHTIKHNKKYVGIAYSSVVNFSIDEFETYEEAELACLETLIEVVESKS